MSADLHERSDQPTASIWTALIKHGVLQAALAYLVFGWLLIQVADATFDTLELPPWSAKFITYVVIGGFPVVVVLAWFLETAGGRLTLDRGKQSGRFFQGLERNYLAIIAAYGIAAVAAGIYQYTVGFSVPDTGPQPVKVVATPDLEVQPQSVAVLRFLNIDGSEKTKMFSDGLGEDLLDRLARVPGLLVSSRGDSWSLPDNAPSTLVRRRLRVAYFVEGSVRLTEDTLRVVVQLIDSEQGFHVMSHSFDRDLADLLSLQNEMAGLIAARLRMSIQENGSPLLAARIGEKSATGDFGTVPTVGWFVTPGSSGSRGGGPGLDAYLAYRQGMDLLHQPYTSESLDEAANAFQTAISFDPEYAAAHAGLCRTYVASFDRTSDTRFIEPAEEACSAALAVNSELDVVQTVLGDLYRRTGRYEESEAAYERALETNPQFVDALRGLSRVYREQQRPDEAEALLLEAIRLQPGNWRMLNSLGGFLFSGGRYDEAAEAYRMILALDPENWEGLGNLGSALLMTGDFEEAATALQRSIAIQNSIANLSNLAIIYYYLGRFDESVAIHRESVKLFPESAIGWLNLADALQFSSNPDEAPDAYRRAAELAERSIAMDPNNHEALCNAAWAHHADGNGAQALALIQRAKALAPTDPYVHYYDALLKTQRGDYDAAVDALNIALANGYPRVMLISEPLLKPLQGSERFSALINVSPGGT